jgi:hypothetical protein
VLKINGMKEAGKIAIVAELKSNRDNLNMSQMKPEKL